MNTTYPNHILPRVSSVSLYTFTVLYNNLKVKIMITTNDVAKVFDTVLSIPGMSEVVKIDLKISRKNVLLLNHVIERGLALENDDTDLLASMSEEGLSELRNVSEECLQKAGLVELNQKLTTLSQACK
jgi:hypothetical protein